MAASLLKGFDYEEAAVLLLVLVILKAARPAFTRRGTLFETRFSIEWLAAFAAALSCSLWLGFFAFQHVDYRNELWWRFELYGEASRFLRGSVGATIVLGLLALARLIRPAPHEAPPPTDTDLDDAARIIAAQSSTFPMLAFLRDKALIFNPPRTAFLMYAVQGRSWVALGDPVGPAAEGEELVRSFLDRCADCGGVPVFYQVTAARMHVYADVGLRCVKIGEEARVDLTQLPFAGGHAARLRQALRRVAKEGATFRVLRPRDVAAALPELRAVSDAWLAARSAAEKGFSLGFFDERYLSRGSLAVIERDGRMLAFANVWEGADHGELSVDLMRYRQDAPAGIMESLFAHIMQWGQEQGYRSFVLGMAPLSGVHRSAVGSLWNRLAAFLYQHGEPLYNFRGLRAFKEKFSPQWEAHYLAYPGGLRLPRIMTDVSALVAGGYRQIFHK